MHFILHYLGSLVLICQAAAIFMTVLISSILCMFSWWCVSCPFAMMLLKEKIDVLVNAFAQNTLFNILQGVLQLVFVL